MNVYRKKVFTQKLGIKLNTIKYICFNYKWKNIGRQGYMGLENQSLEQRLNTFVFLYLCVK